jgi:hypothetical protein
MNRAFYEDPFFNNGDCNYFKYRILKEFTYYVQQIWNHFGNIFNPVFLENPAVENHESKESKDS